MLQGQDIRWVMHGCWLEFKRKTTVAATRVSKLTIPRTRFHQLRDAAFGESLEVPIKMGQYCSYSIVNNTLLAKF